MKVYSIFALIIAICINKSNATYQNQIKSRPENQIETQFESHIDNLAENDGPYLFDDKRLNYLGAGQDVLTSEARESIFQLESDTRSDPRSGILTRTLPKYVVMKSNPSEEFKFYSNIQSMTSSISDSRDIAVSGGGGYLSV